MKYNEYEALHPESANHKKAVERAELLSKQYPSLGQRFFMMTPNEQLLFLMSNCHICRTHNHVLMKVEFEDAIFRNNVNVKGNTPEAILAMTMLYGTNTATRLLGVAQTNDGG